MNADEPTTLYTVHRAVVLAIGLLCTLAGVLAVTLLAPSIIQWVLGVIRTLHATWLSWHWSLW